jgi:CxxC-x17-CxxC domain-containing protein
MTSEINLFAETTSRGQLRRFGIKLDDRRRHMYIIGKTGMGKSQMIQNMAIQDIQAGRGIGLIDPHGELVEGLLDYIPKHRVNDVIYFNPADVEHPMGFNIMDSVGVEERFFIASGLMAAFKKIWVDVWSSRMEYILNNALLALLEYPNATILGANRMLADKDYRKKVVDNVKDPAVKSYWINEFAKYPERYREEATSAIQNKIGQFISNPLVRNIVGQTKSTYNIREAMDDKKIVLINLSKGRIGEDNTALLGTMFITKLQIAAMSRVDIPEEQRNDFFLYVDEFQTFATPSFAGILSEARKYRLALILAHQYIAQMDEIVRDAVYGNAGTLVTFRVGAADAEFLENEYAPSFTPEDLVNLGKFNIAVKLMIDGVSSRAFSAQTLPPIGRPEECNTEKIIRVSAERYGTSRADIEEKITRWSGIGGKELDEGSGEGKGKSQNWGFDATCSECKKDIKVSFQPDGKRPVYCKDCLANKMRERDKGNQGGTPPNVGGLNASPQSFGTNATEQDAPAQSPVTPVIAPARETQRDVQPDTRNDNPISPTASSNVRVITPLRRRDSRDSARRLSGEISLADAMKRFPPKDATPARRSLGEGAPRVQLASAQSTAQPESPTQMSVVKRVRKEVNLSSLRETLQDVAQKDRPPRPSQKLQRLPKTQTSEAVSGIIEEGEEVVF